MPCRPNCLYIGRIVRCQFVSSSLFTRAWRLEDGRPSCSLPSYSQRNSVQFTMFVGPDVQIPVATGQESLSQSKISGAVPSFPLLQKPQAKGIMHPEGRPAFIGTVRSSGRLSTVAFLLHIESFHRIATEQLCSRYEQRPMKLLSKNTAAVISTLHL